MSRASVQAQIAALQKKLAGFGAEVGVRPATPSEITLFNKWASQWTD